MACALLFPLPRRGDRGTMPRMRRGHGHAGTRHRHHHRALLRMRRVRHANDYTGRLHQHNIRLRGYDGAEQHYTLHFRLLDLLGVDLRAQHAVVHAQRNDNVVHAERERAHLRA